MSALPDPPVPADCDMAGNDWFRLYFDRLRKSKWWRRASDMARARNVMLWGEAYKQVPAGSMPDDDDELAEAAGFGMDVDAFAAVKAEIMAPWVLCRDGRWYHPTLCEQTLEEWERRGSRRKAESTRKADYRRRVREGAVVPRNAASVPLDMAGCPAGHGLVSRGTSPIVPAGLGQEERRGEDITSIAGAIDERAHADAPALKPLKQPRQKARRELPEHFPGDDEADYARDEFARNGLPFDFEREAQRFRNHHQSKGSLMADWRAAWRTWVANGIKFAAEAEARHASGPNPRRANGRAPWSAMDYAADRIREEEGFE